MKQYIEQKDGSFKNGSLRIPASEGNRYYSIMLNEVSTGIAEIINYSGPDLDSLKAYKILEIDKACRDQIEAGFISSALGMPHRYSSKLEDQINIAGNVLFAQLGNPSDNYCYTAEDVRVRKTHTPDQMIQVGVDIQAHKSTQLVKAGSLKEQILNAADKTTLESISW